MPGCAVAECKNYNRKTKGTVVNFFSFPKNDVLARLWIAACRRKDEINLKNARICSIHFEDDCFEVPLKQKLLKYTPKNCRNLKDDARPTKNLPQKSEKRQNDERSARMAKRLRRDVIKDIILKSSQSGNIQEVVKSVHGENIHEAAVLNLENTHESQKLPIETNQTEVAQLREKIKMLEDQIHKLSTEVEEAKNNTARKYEDALARVFTPGQITKLMNSKPGKINHWSPEDIASAISLRSVSPKAYRYLRAHNYPLPAMSTLRRWVSNFSVDPGILQRVLLLMKAKASEMKEIERLCVLTFDEVYLSNKIDIDKKVEQAVGPHKTCQTVMVRGLFSHWKQPLYYQFDQAMKKEILEDIISQLYSANFVVVAMVSDMGTANVKLWSKLEVGYNKSCYFPHPSDSSLKIFVYADVPHLIKLARNHLLDQGFIIENKIINIDYFEALLNISTSELTLAHKLTPQHLCVAGAMRQRVRPAVQLLSNSVAKALLYAGRNGLMPKNSHWEKASEIVQLFNDWFDLLNSRSKCVGNCPTRDAYGTNLNKQRSLLMQMSDVVGSMRVGNHEQLIPFQKGILLTNRSLSEMYEYLHKKYYVDYIMTARLNQDVLENFFSYIRGMGGSNDHPTPLDFKFRLRWYILGKNSTAIFTENRNTIESDESCLVQVLNETKNSNNYSSTGDDHNSIPTDDVCLTEKMLFNFTEKEIESVLVTEEEKSVTHAFVEPQYLEEETIDEQILHVMETETH